MKIATGTTLISNGQLFDGTGALPVPNAALVLLGMSIKLLSKNSAMLLASGWLMTEEHCKL